MKNYFKHKTTIPLGKKGELSKISEEFAELIDVHNQGKKFFAVVESSDLITTVGWYTWKKYKVPFLLVVLFAYLRKPYKWLRDPILRYKYKTRKEDVIPTMQKFDMFLVINSGNTPRFYDTRGC